MVQILKLDHLEYKEAIVDSPEFREKLKRHEKYIAETSKNIKLLLKKFDEVVTASETLRNAQDSFSLSLKEFQVGFIGDTNEEESDIVDTLDCTYSLFQDVKEFSTKMINTGHTLIKQLEIFRKDRLEILKDKKKEYEKQTVKYCTTLEKYLQSQYSSKREKNSEDSTDAKEADKYVREENQLFYQKCLEYVLCIQEFEEKWFHFFSESMFAFVQSCTTFYHEGYEKHSDTEARYTKSQGGIQTLANNFDYFKSRSKELINDILKDPDYFINSYQSFSSDHNLLTSKQGYLYLLEKKTLGSSTRVKQFCKYYKEIKKLEVISFSQTVNKIHQPDVYLVVNCQKSSIDKRFVFDLTIRDRGSTYVNTYQALSYDDYKAWFAIMEGKELTPVSTSYSSKTDPIYNLDRGGINFIKKCIQLLEEEKINEEGIYRKNGVSHKINQFIEKNFANHSNSLINESGIDSQQQQQQGGLPSSSSSPAVSLTAAHLENNSNHQGGGSSSSFISNVLKSAANNITILSNSPSFSALNFLANNNNNNNNNNSNNKTGNSSSNNNDQTDSSFTLAAANNTTFTLNGGNTTTTTTAANISSLSSSASTSSSSQQASPQQQAINSTTTTGLNNHNHSNSNNNNNHHHHNSNNHHHHHHHHHSNNNNQSTTSSPSPNAVHHPNQSSSSNLNDSLDDTCTITSALKHYLIHLREPLMTFSNNHHFLSACRKENLIERVSEIHRLLHELPAANFEAIELLMKHLNKISKHSGQNKMTTSNLATCFGPTVFRAEQESVSNLYNIKFYTEIVELLITNCEEMFKPVLDQNFLQSLTPLKSPPTMLSGALHHIQQQQQTHSNNNSGNSKANQSTPSTFWSSNSQQQSQTPASSSSSNNKHRSTNNPTPSQIANKHEQAYRKNMLNSSKTSVSSDSSQSEKDLQFNNSSNLALSPLSSSSPNTHAAAVHHHGPPPHPPSSSSSSSHNHHHNNSNQKHNNQQRSSALLSSQSAMISSSSSSSTSPNGNLTNSSSSTNAAQITTTTTSMTHSSPSSNNNTNNKSNKINPHYLHQIQLQQQQLLQTQQQQQQPLDSTTMNMHKLAIVNSLNSGGGSNGTSMQTNGAANRPASVSLVSLPLHGGVVGGNGVGIGGGSGNLVGGVSGVISSGSKSVNTSPSNSRLSNMGGLASVSAGPSSSSTSSSIGAVTAVGSGGGGVGVQGNMSGGSSSAVATNSNASLNSSFNYFTNLAISNLEYLSKSNKPRRARTLFPCEADNPSELSFEANVIISNVRRSKESGWLEATYNGKSGLVPGNYVQILDD